MKNPTDKGIIGETRDLYERLSREAIRQVKRDHETARQRGPAAKALLAACFIAGVLAAVTLVYGIIKFPDAPIRETASGYTGKHGAPYTREDYERFKLWEKLLAASFGMAFLTGFGAAAVEKVGKRHARKPIE